MERMNMSIEWALTWIFLVAFVVGNIAYQIGRHDGDLLPKN
jgi:hypothetical protein